MLKVIGKIGWIAGIFLSAVLLSGCGGGGGGGGNDLPDESTKTAMKQVSGAWNYDVANNLFSVHLTLENTLDAKVTLDNFNFYLGGCQIVTNSLTFNGQSETTLQFLTAGQSNTLRIEGRLVDTTCIPSNYTLTYHEKIEKDGKTRDGNYALNLNLGGGGGTPENGYTFFNVTTPLNVTQANASYEIRAQLLKDGKAVAGEGVQMKAFDDHYGYISNPDTTTGRDGYARFNYTSPATLPASGTTATLTIMHTDENNNTIETNVVLQFGTSHEVLKEYNLTNVTSPITITTPGELQTISAVVVDRNNISVKDHTVSITAVSEAKYGMIVSDATVTSDGSGRVHFTYQAPDDLSTIDGNSTIVTLFLQEDSYTVTRSVEIRFRANNDDQPIPIVVVPDSIKEVNLTSNSQAVEMQIRVFDEKTNAPYTEGNVKVILPDEVLEGIDVGRFESYEVAVGSDGIATFNYTGPQDLQSLIDDGHTSAIFTFFHEDNDHDRGETVTVNYTPDDDYIPANYYLQVNSQDGNFTMNLKSEKTFSILLKDDRGEPVESSDIHQITIKSMNFNVGKLIDTGNNNEVDTLTFTDDDAINNKPFPMRSGTVSGLVPIEVEVQFTDGNGQSQTLSTVVNITVFSGPPTALSISYVGVTHDEIQAKYIEKFDVFVTDAYSNPVNTRPYISTGAIVEYAVDGTSSDGSRTSTSPRLWHGFATDSAGNRLDTLGKLVKVGTDQAKFVSDVNETFRYIDIDNDKFVVFGPGYVYEALGKWDISTVTDNDGTLELVDNYFGETRENLGFAVGHNHRLDLCSDDAREYIGNMRSNTYQVNSNGHVSIEFEYDYHLTGKDITVWVNLSGYQADEDKTVRIGEARKHTLRGNGLISPQSYTLQPGESKRCWFNIDHENVPEHYKNAHFGAAVKGTCTVLGIIDTSNWRDARDCTNGGYAYIELNVTNNGGVTCTIELDRINVASEFSSSTTW